LVCGVAKGVPPRGSTWGIGAVLIAGCHRRPESTLPPLPPRGLRGRRI
jgi:hypothetical protein